MPSAENTLPVRTRVAVIYGGRSTESEISLQSAASVVANLDRTRYEILPIYIDERGKFHRQALPAIAANHTVSLPARTDAQSLMLAARPGQLFAAGESAESPIDVVFPVMHGPLCEDGSIQGLLELADMPYVGSRVLGSALCMDKDLAKRLVRAEGIPIVPYVALRGTEWEQDHAAQLQRIEREIGYPAFIKPATLGSSVGVSPAATRDELLKGIATALTYDDKLLVEKAVQAREIEFAVLAAEREGAPPEISVPGEIAARDDFYSFERKYLDAEGAVLRVPAELDAATLAKGRDAVRRIFQALECEGMSRVDFFLDRRSGELYFNEVNTIPGFTAISMYPKLWEASGLSYSQLLDRLVRDALQRHARRSRLRRAR
jgi:D-alanine-D-alanine ligase